MEIWKSVKGYEGHYEVSDLGRVRSIKFEDFIIMKTKLTGSGIVRHLGLNLNLKGVKKTKQVHKLVAIAFLDHVPCGHELVIDHIDNNPLNNRLENLQEITQRLNITKDKKGSSKYAGIYWDKRSEKWIARIFINGKRKYLGLFKDEIDASNAYQEALSLI